MTNDANFLFGVDLTENMEVTVGEKLCTPFCQVFWGMYTFLSSSLKQRRRNIESVSD